MRVSGGGGLEMRAQAPLFAAHSLGITSSEMDTVTKEQNQIN